MSHTPLRLYNTLNSFHVPCNPRGASTCTCSGHTDQCSTYTSGHTDQCSLAHQRSNFPFEIRVPIILWKQGKQLHCRKHHSTYFNLIQYECNSQKLSKLGNNFSICYNLHGHDQNGTQMPELGNDLLPKSFYPYSTAMEKYKNPWPMNHPYPLSY